MNDASAKRSSTDCGLALLSSESGPSTLFLMQWYCLLKNACSSFSSISESLRRVLFPKEISLPYYRLDKAILSFSWGSCDIEFMAVQYWPRSRTAVFTMLLMAMRPLPFTKSLSALIVRSVFEF